MGELTELQTGEAMSEELGITRGNYPTTKQAEEIRFLVRVMRRVAEPAGGPAHPWWGLIFDLEAIAIGNKPVVDMAIPEHIAGARRVIASEDMQLAELLRFYDALALIRHSGNDNNNTVVWMQKVAARAMAPYQWPDPGPPPGSSERHDS
jgi:hypothetical protein